MSRKNIKVFTLATAIVMITLVFNWGMITSPEESTVLAADNMIEGGDFEGNISRNWVLWTGASASRNYDIYRSYGAGNVPFGQGSYSATISTDGSADNRWDAGLTTQRSFTVENGAEYYLVLYTKSVSSDFNISAYLDNGSTAISNIMNVSVSTEWEKHTILLSPTTSGSANLSFAFGNIPVSDSLMIDGVGLYRADFELKTDGTRGMIGDEAKLKISDIEMFGAEDIEIELPYFDPLTGTPSVTRINPHNISRGYVYFDYPTGTYAGVGRVLVSGSEIGSFNYDVVLKISDVYPAMPRADEDVTIVGTGFHPSVDTNVYVIMKAIGADGRAYEYWAQPDYIDSSLTQITIATPNGIMSSKLYVLSSYLDINNEAQTNRSNYLNYQVKPVIYSVDWSERGYDQVGDDLTITGKGISSNPKVMFYDLDNNLIDSKKGKLVNITDVEYVEVQSTTKTNQYQISIVCNHVESDNSMIGTYSANPRMEQMRTGEYRRLPSGEKINAAKVGDIITIKGVSLYSENTYISFTGPENTRISVDVPVENIAENGTSLTVVVPQGSMSGQVSVLVNGQESNSLPLELIPVIIDYTPEQIGGGTGLEITAAGLGTDSNLISVIFSTDGNEEIITPESVWYEGGLTHVYLVTPINVSNSTVISLSYDNWSSDNSAVATAAPYVSSAGFNMDTGVLTIKGYGFSNTMSENDITYMYADEDKTIIDPQRKMLGVYTTPEGQEIRIQILDDYHYGYVTITVNGQTSNEAQFGPVSVSRIARRVEYVQSESRVMGVLYISGTNMGESGGVRVGDVWADIHYRTNFFIIAVVEESQINNNPVIVARD